MDPKAMPPDRLFLYLLCSRYTGAGIGPFDSPKDDVLESSLDYLVLKEERGKCREKWLRKLSGATDEDFHAGGRKRRIQERLRQDIEQKVESFLSLLSECDLAWDDATKVRKSQAECPEVFRQLRRTSSIQPKPESEQHELYAKIYLFPKEVIEEAERKVLEIGHCAVGLALLEEVSRQIDASESGEYIFKRRYYRSEAVVASREVWKKRDKLNLAEPAQMARHVRDNYQVEGYDPESKEDMRALYNAAYQNFRNWSEDE